MLVAVWIGVGVLVVAFVAGAAFAGVRGLAVFRVVRRAGRELTGGMDRVARDAEQITVKLERLGPGSARLQAVLTRLHASRARLDVLLAALADVRAAVGRIRSVVPRKS